MKIAFLFILGLIFILGCTQAEDKCNYKDTSKKYIAQSEEECRLVKFFCVNGTKPFFNECGCGCEGNQIPENQDNQTQNNSSVDPAGGISLEDEHLCTDDESKSEICAEIYEPVCGYFDPSRIQCIKFPCAQDFSNGCYACADEKIKYWARGECPK